MMVFALAVALAGAPSLAFSPALVQLGRRSGGVSLRAGHAEMAAASAVRRLRMPLIATGRGAQRAALSPLRMVAEPTVAADAPVVDLSGNKPTRHFTEGGGAGKPFRIVLIAGFETFNRNLYRRAADQASAECPGALEIFICTDRDIQSERDDVDAALTGADVVFTSLVFDFDQVNWLKERIDKIPTRFIFESALELMGDTKVGTFTMGGPPATGEKKAGPPPAVKALLSKFGSGREEDRLDGYTKFLKSGPALLKFVPGEKAKDLRSWLQTYAYWNAGGRQNVALMFRFLASEFGGVDMSDVSSGVAGEKREGLEGVLKQVVDTLLNYDMIDPKTWPVKLVYGDSTPTNSATISNGQMVPAAMEAPQRGLVHPDRPGFYFSGPKEFLQWYRRKNPESANWPTVGVLLYRKHVISELPYIEQLVRHMESQKITPLPLFISGVDGHIAVRDSLTSVFETEQVARGEIQRNPTMSSEAVNVDAVVSTIGFPLVGGPAGSMEGARQAELAKEILLAKNVPYFVAAPLLIQDVKAWFEQGIGGLQSVVLYALPELDGAIDAIPLGGLCCGDKAFCNSQRDLANCPREAGEIRLVEERLFALTKRITAWTSLRRKAPKDRRVAIVLYGYPPGIGATGTAALLNVPQSLYQLLCRMRDEGYDVGDLPENPEDIVEMVRVADTESESGRGYKNDGYKGDGGGSVTVKNLTTWLGKSDSARVSKNWGGRLDKSGIRTVGSGDDAQMLLGGRMFGNVWIAVQPPLGVPGDPMRLLFQRDMTPHPQYTAFYKYMENDEANGGMNADAVVHFGMHGTEEWLPGTPLGNTGECWPDILTGGLPNVYVYAANNPSESLLAKRRGYGTLVSHNVPPYSRAGLYKELVSLRGLMADYQETEMRIRNEGLKGAGESEEAANGFSTGGGGSGGLGGGVGGVGGGKVAQAVDSSKLDALEGAPTTEGALLQTVFAAGLDKDCPLPEGAMAAIEAAGGVGEGEKAMEAGAAYMAKEDLLAGYCENLKVYLAELEMRLFSSGLHVLGRAPSDESMRAYLTAYFEDGSWQQGDKSSTDATIEVQGDGASEKVDVAEMPFPESVLAMILQATPEPDVLMFKDDPAIPVQGTKEYSVYQKAVREAINIRSLLLRNTEELDGVVRALNGEFVPPAPGGDLLRDGSGVLPTGRNIHALDPYRLPSKVAMSRGRAAAGLTLEMHKKDNEGELPETVAVNLWGLEAIKTRGESVAIVLALIGAEPVMEATGRVVRYELIPLEELGRPRVDVLASLSGIFRDSFANVVELLDDLFVRAAQVDEPIEMNYIRKHFLELQAEGESVEASTARIFSNPPGEFGSMVNERVSDGSWEDEGELGETWASRNSFSFGREGKGVPRRKTLDALMKTTTQVVQCIDSVEYGLTDIQEYYANTGAMVRAMDDIQGGAGKVQATVVEGFAREARPKKLNDVLRLEYRSKLLNPKWADEMVSQGSGGAFEVSQRMTAMIGWGATTKFKEKWVFDQSAETYALDPVMAKRLMDANPEAFKNIVGRLLEATNRGMWEPSPDVLAQLQDLYSDIDDAIEVGTSTIRRPTKDEDRK